MSLAATLAELEALMLREASRKERARSRIICGTERNTAREQQRAKGNIIGQDTHTVLPQSHQLRPGRVSGEGGAEHEGVEQSGGVTTLPSTTLSSSVWKMGKGRGLLKLDRPSNYVLCLGHRSGGVPDYVSLSGKGLPACVSWSRVFQGETNPKDF